jgi:hypothetical protein
MMPFLKYNPDFALYFASMAGTVDSEVHFLYGKNMTVIPS